MNKAKFSLVAESLRKFQRAELKEFEGELGKNPVDKVYMDPLEDNAVLNTVLAGNTTFLFGRKGTGKSTIISRAQSEIRKRNKSISIYVDVKSVNESSQTSDVISGVGNEKIIFDVIQPHLLRKAFLIDIFTKIVDEVDAICKQSSMIDRFLGKNWKYEELKNEIFKLKERARSSALNEAELPILQLIEVEAKNKHVEGAKNRSSASIGGSAGLEKIGFNSDLSSEDIEEVLDDQEIYEKYSQAVLRTFPYQEFIKKLSDLLTGC